MSGDNHTPGPWRQNGLSVEIANGMALEVAIVRNAGLGLAPKSLDEAKANARLMAAAPDLLTACEAAYHALRSYQYGNTATKLAEGVADDIAVAIAKARGRP